MKEKILNLMESDLTELTEEQLINICQLSNFKPGELEGLLLSHNSLTDINFIQSNTPFINLKTLWLTDNQINNINNLKYLTKLKDLQIGLNFDINDITSLKFLINLKTLYLESLDIQNILVLKSLINLEVLDLNGIDIKNMTPLKSLVNLEVLDLRNNTFLTSEDKLTDIIKDLKKLKTLYFFESNNVDLDIDIKSFRNKFQNLSII